jgi:hypothetical protein
MNSGARLEPGAVSAGAAPWPRARHARVRGRYCRYADPCRVPHDPLTAFTRRRILTVVLGRAYYGAADRYLGMLSTVLERWDEADADFERAFATEQRMRGPALLPHTR